MDLIERIDREMEQIRQALKSLDEIITKQERVKHSLDVIDQMLS